MKRILIGLMVVSACGGLLATEACKTFKIRQEDIPFVTPEPGKYLLCEDVTWDGIGPAITVNQDRVELCLFAHSIRLTDASATGILVNNPTRRICEININNDAIINESTDPQTGNGIHVDNACKVRIHNMFTINHLRGLLIENSSDVRVERSEFFNGGNGVVFGNGAQVLNSEDVVFEHSVFKDNDFGISLEVGAKDCQIVHCSFPNSRRLNLITDGTNGLLVKDCSFSRTEATNEDLVFIGGESPSDNVLIEGCTFIAKGNGNRAISFFGTGLIIDSCLVDMLTNEEIGDFENIQVLAGSTNVLITGSVIQGAVQADEVRTGITVFGTDTIIQDCLVQGMTNGIALAGNGNTVRTTSVQNNGNGIIVNGSSHVVANNAISRNVLNGISTTGTAGVQSLHTIKDNTISANGVSGIIFNAVSSSTISENEVLANGANGIDVNATSVKNNIQYNRVHSHIVGTGILDSGAAGSNEYYYNTSHNNLIQYTPVIIPTQQAPGVATKEASNIL